MSLGSFPACGARLLAAAWLVSAPFGCTVSHVSVLPSTAADFLNGGERGFVIGRVDPSRDDAFFDVLGGTGANVGRIFLPIERDASGRGFVLAEPAVSGLRYILGKARQQHMKLVVVADFAGVDQPAFWNDGSLRESFVATWRSIAGKLGNDPGIAGLDLMNEPNPPSPAGSLADMRDTWRVLAQQAVSAIRRQHVVLPIVFEPVAGGGTLGFRDLTPLDDPQVVYSLHFYTPLEITHQRVDASWTRSIPYPAGEEWRLGSWDPELGTTRIDKRRLELELRDVIAFQELYKVPIFVGEFSCVRWAPGGSAARYVGDLLDIFTQHGWSWTYHEYRGWSGWDPEIGSEDRGMNLRSAGSPVMLLLRTYLHRAAT